MPTHRRHVGKRDAPVHLFLAPLAVGERHRALSRVWPSLCDAHRASSRAHTPPRFLPQAPRSGNDSGPVFSATCHDVRCLGTYTVERASPECAQPGENMIGYTTVTMPPSG